MITKKNLKVAFSRHLPAINDAYQRYFATHNEIEFVFLDRPRWSDGGIVKYFYMARHMLKCFWDFSIGKYDLIHINGPMVGLVAYLSSFFRGRYIYTNHGCPNPKVEHQEGRQKMILSLLGEVLMRVVVKRAANVYTISKYSQTMLWNNYHIKADVIYNGINKEALQGTSSASFKGKHGLVGKTVFISVGRMINIKNPCLVIDVFCQLCKEIDNAFLILIGDGNLWEETHLHAVKMGLNANNILIIRNIPFFEMGEWYANSDYFISGNAEEPFGLAPLEAVACGCVPLLPKSGGFPEVYQEDKYFYDPSCLADLHLPEVNDKDREWMRNLISKFSWDKAIGKYKEAYIKYAR